MGNGDEQAEKNDIEEEKEGFFQVMLLTNGMHPLPLRHCAYLRLSTFAVQDSCNVLLKAVIV